MIAIVDSGVANVASVRFALERLGVDFIVTADPETVERSSHVVLPGVGAAAPAMASHCQISRDAGSDGPRPGSPRLAFVGFQMTSPGWGKVIE